MTNGTVESSDRCTPFPVFANNKTCGRISLFLFVFVDGPVMNGCRM